MSTDQWNRVSFLPSTWNTVHQFHLLAALTPGQSILRVRFGWRASGWTSTTVIPTAIMGQEVSFGLVTKVGVSGTDSPPDLYTQSSNQVPPEQRWLWLERRVMTLAAWDSAGSTALWTDSGPQEPADAQGQVLAGTHGGGQTCNLWMTFQAGQSWDPSGQAVFWGYANVLVRSP